MFSTSHDFTAVAFVFSRKEFPHIRSAKDVLQLLPKTRTSDIASVLPVLPGVELLHALYYSQIYHPRTDDENTREEIRVFRYGKEQYKYDIYCLADITESDVCCAVASPFAGLGRELFREIHNAGGERRPLYRRVVLSRALKALQRGSAKQARISVRWIQIPLKLANADRLWLSGKDVVHSTPYSLLPKLMELLTDDVHESEKYAPECCEFAYDADLVHPFRLVVDDQGVYSFYLGVNRKSLNCIFELFRFFRQQKATEDRVELPWRGGLTAVARPVGGAQ